MDRHWRRAVHIERRAGREVVHAASKAEFHLRFRHLRLRALTSRPALILLAATIATVALAACRGGGAAPSGSPTIPVIQPTPSQSECANSVYPAEAPQFQPEDVMDLTETASGLKYLVLQQGEGAKPSSTAPVITRYTGWLSQGCVIDSSFLRNPDTTTFGLGQSLIPGWKEGLQDMQVGEKRMLVMPPELGYGPLGQAPRVPPNSTLIYYVELVDILDPAEATATVETRITATAQALETVRANAEATATAFSGGVPATATPTIAPTP